MCQAGGAFMRVIRWFIACSALCSLLCLQAVIAQDTGQKLKQDEQCPAGAKCPEKEKPKPLLPTETIVVTSIFQDGAVTLEPTKTVVDMSKFESGSSVDKVEDVLKNMAGIDVIRGTGGADPQQVIMMRGFDDSRFQVAINGRPITSPTAGADTFVDWSSLTAGDIDKIEIIRGSASARYENSAGGVINIITKKGKKENGYAPNSTVDVSYSSFNTLNTRGTISGGIGQLGYFINFGSRKSDGFLRNNYWDGMDYSGRLDYTLPGKGSLSTSFKRSELEHGYPVVNDPKSVRSNYDSEYPLVAYDADTLRLGRFISYPGGKSYKAKKATHFDVAYDQPLGHSDLSIKYFTDRGSEDSYSYQRNAAVWPDICETSPGDKQCASRKLVQTFSGQGDRKEKTNGVMFDYQMNFWSKHSLSIGYSHRRMQVHNMPDIYRIQGAYVEDQYAVTNKIVLNLGLRYMHVREYSYTYKGLGDTFSYRHLIYSKEWLPKFTATYHFNKETEVFVSMNRDYHVPGC
jgi:outer membrane receptor protein involved in Fe transport